MAGHSHIDWLQLARGLCRLCPLLKGCSVIKRFPLSVRHPSALMMVSRRGGAERDGPVRVTSVSLLPAVIPSKAVLTSYWCYIRYVPLVDYYL